ncbi:hypothetical protein BDK51DRAFT_32618 [Blyttiomyces helicus]|uniref:Uncharacterized protein n=1 Tax=Blyttiomyces helicus TaxID=388810 RepID=A0A4V1IQR3_9FUNG|nr:hypothetical protein BDK51DRAFT_32618 [Blyttiomyces helicus]|eukprot:RKO87457.1 hypothetical protein BDK51DRAFT_32618 [Blyttiomyces helicus]
MADSFCVRALLLCLDVLFRGLLLRSSVAGHSNVADGPGLSKSMEPCSGCPLSLEGQLVLLPETEDEDAMRNGKQQEWSLFKCEKQEKGNPSLPRKGARGIVLLPELVKEEKAKGKENEQEMNQEMRRVRRKERRVLLPDSENEESNG